MKDEPLKRVAQKSKHQPGEKAKGQEAVQSRLWELILKIPIGESVDGFRPSTLFGCSEKD
jgi:hypothetical protein